jgi:hypothetical protein
MQGVKTMKIFLMLLSWLFYITSIYGQTISPPPIDECKSEPVKYIGTRQTDTKYNDGALPHVVGVHHYQTFRANRENPPMDDPVGWTYNHQPYLCYWNGQFYYQFLSNVIEEHNPPGRTSLMTSKDGRQWSKAEVVFPIYSLPEIVIPGKIYLPEGTTSVMHQRMGFYIAPNGRLLTSGFYGFSASAFNSPNSGNGLGRVVREIYQDATCGPVYFIRYNRHAGYNEHNTTFPFYKSSADQGFVKACEALLADKLKTLQWWEEDRGKDGFYVMDPSDVSGAFNFTYKMTTSRGAGKALAYYFRPDGIAVGLWKNQYAALSPDSGKSWTPIAVTPTIIDVGAKTWGQRTVDGKYLLAYNHNKNRKRYPTVIVTSENGYEFDNMLSMQGEVPLQRYYGNAKGWGSQYIRGILPGNGNPPGDKAYIVYSMNKEDMWITHARIPVSGTVDKDVDENFNDVITEADLDLWNLYMPKWAPISVVSDQNNSKNKSLQLNDKDPYDYALAERTFPESKKINVKFDLLLRQANSGRMEIDITSKTGVRPIQIMLNESGKVQVVNSADTVSIGSYKTNVNLSFGINLDTEEGKFSVAINGKEVLKNADFAAEVEKVQRIVFRTGQYRGLWHNVRWQDHRDLSNPGEPVKEAVYLLDNVVIQN